MTNYRAHSDEAIINALKEHGSQRKAAAALGLNSRTLERRLKRMRLRGYSPEYDMVKMVPEGFTVGGVSTLYDKNGQVVQQWVKSRQDPEAVQRMLDAALEAFKSEIPREKPLTGHFIGHEDLLNCYVLTDYHLGMLSWAEETGADWDMEIAESTIVRWFQMAIERSPAADTALLAQLGDFLHWDSLDAVTPTNRHLLDADTRFAKLIRTAIRIKRRVIRMLLTKYQHVHLIEAEGNHDLASSVQTREWLAAMYEDEPRVTIDTSPDPYYCYEHGLTSLFFHHGHKRPLRGIEEVFAAKFREVFGRTKFSYAHMGHLHHIDIKESNLMVVEQHRTLAAPDAHASRSGYNSGRDAQVITYSKRFGEVSRLRISTHMLGL